MFSYSCDCTMKGNVIHLWHHRFRQHYHCLRHNIHYWLQSWKWKSVYNWLLKVNPFPPAHFEQFLFWPQCFQLCLTIKPSFMDIFQVFGTMFSKSCCVWERVKRHFHLFPWTTFLMPQFISMLSAAERSYCYTLFYTCTEL